MADSAENLLGKALAHYPYGRGHNKLTEIKYANFKKIKWSLKSMLSISADEAGVRQAADLIQSQIKRGQP